MISDDSSYEETKINNEGNQDKNHQDSLGIKQKSSQQSRSYFQKPQMQQQKENLQEVNPSLFSTQVATQKIRVQFESKLELGLEQESLIQSQIQGTQDDIEIFQKKNQQNNLLQIKDTLVEQAEKFAQEQKNQLKQTEICQNQTLQQQLESQLNELLNELELTDAKLITEEIEDFSYIIQRQISRNQINMTYGSKIRLNKLNEAQVKYKALLELEGQILLDSNQVKQQSFDVEQSVLPKELNLEDESCIQSQVKLYQNQSQQQLLKKKLNDLLQELDLEDESQIQSQIKLYQNQNQVQLLQFEEKLNVLPQELDLEDESQIQSQVKFYQNQVKQQQFEEKLNVLQQELDLDDESLIQSKVNLYQIENFQNQNLLKNAYGSKTRLEKLKEAQRIQILLNNKSNENQIEQPQPKNSNNSHIKLKENEFQNSDLPQNQPFDVIKQYNLSDLRQDISLIPESSEKYLLEMIEICLNIYKQVDTPQTDPGNSQLLTQKEKIEKRLIIEDQKTPEISLHLQNIQQNIDQDNFKGIIDETDMLIKKVRPLNINEMKRLIHEVDKAAQAVEGQDIIILLGGTGVGKSTTIHFLAGSEMAERKIEIEKGVFKNYIGPVEIKNKTLQKVKVGYSATSETRFITPVNINFKDLNMVSSDSIILCDSPGFDVISGPEVDIANGLGIVKVIKKCRSVRPVILLSFESQGDRGQGIKQLAHILIGFVNDIQDKISSLSYLFSKYPKDYNINSELINIKNIIDQITEEKSDEAFTILIDDMIEKTKKSRNIIDPLKGNPTEILNNLMKQEGIQDPSQVFKFSITNNSYSAITNYIFKTKQIIISALSRSEYELINFKLDELKFLIEILNLESIKKVYEDCVNYIKEAIKKDYENATEQLNQQIENKFIQKCSQIQSLRNNHLSANFSNSNELIDELKLAVKKLAQVFGQENIIQSPVLVEANLQEDIPNNIIRVVPQKAEEQFESQLNQLLQELELEDARLRTKEIEEVKILIEKQTSRNQIINASNSQKRLDKLNDAKAKYNALLKLKGETQLYQNQVKQQQLEEKLKALLKDLDLEDASLIEYEIEDLLEDIDKHKKKNQQSQVLEKKETLKKLEDAQQVAQELKDLKQQTEGFQNQTQQQQLEIQLNQLLQELELDDARQITEEIEEVKNDIQKFTNKKQLSKASESKIRLDKLNEAQVKYKALLEMKGETQLDQNQVKQQQLEEKLKALLKDLDLQNTSQIESEIKDLLEEIDKHKKKNQQSKVLEKKETLKKLEDAQQVAQELKDLKQQIEGSQNQTQQQQLEIQLNQLLQELGLEDARLIEQARVKQFLLDQNQVKKQQLEEKLKALLEVLDLEDESQIQAEIQVTLDQIEICQKKNQQNKVLRKKQTLEKLKEAEQIAQELKIINKQTTYQQQLESELSQIFIDLDINDANLLQEEINDVENQIEKYMSKNQLKDTIQSKIRLEKLKKASAIHKELLELKGEILLDQNQVKQQDLIKEKLKVLLKELDIENGSYIQSEIQEALDLIESYQKKNKQNKALQKKETLEKLRVAEQIAQELNDLKQYSQMPFKNLVN
ncbi:hypothetical protein TTHERM_00263680 (macronuclear) [Tetrahymena thermophila SB210]|uniref:Uncharacterized protein n=1 Tax=Tetrahymena thermophila (strain SB210) TaxID=312017 RepID=Q22U15_TETTS|nr:hypothetical protein TTHERM_00263680 [Tetrahymena thermophila SB210]EAR88872.3 hypothetical protein TTHERM_00263680 [Tetrahymena thermophila SB210]|eukprot:XP_001009117.3 hypothetical protein TTHERM_00263680 [Tetrahymena thermophila SB210]